uniref:Glycos_transf_1 n=1 Tax=uncultured Rhizobium sp. TaxID=155567 RepID=A0A060C7C8_9HYPH|nr:Glycos_transf_1 [uncultured Rhizobium sp.]
MVAEAMSFGKPVISTDVGDAAAIVGDTGFIVPPGEPARLADAVRKLLDLDQTEYAALCAAAKGRIEKSYSLLRISELYDQFLRGVAAASRPSNMTSSLRIPDAGI